jgi:hypothetical protein
MLAVYRTALDDAPARSHVEITRQHLLEVASKSSERRPSLSCQKSAAASPKLVNKRAAKGSRGDRSFISAMFTRVGER